MKAGYQIVVNKVDITALLADRLMELRITDKPGIESDQCTIKIDDRDNVIELPPKGATASIKLGWQDTGLLDFGTYIIDHIACGFGPRTLTFVGKPADLRGAAKSHRHAGYENTTLATIVQTVAARHGWQAVCTVQAVISRVDQYGESDFHFVTRLAKQYGATATVKDGKLLVMPRNAGYSASGKVMPSIILKPNDVFPGGEIELPDRSGYAKVTAVAHNRKTGEKVAIEVENNTSVDGITAVHIDRHEYIDEIIATAAAKAKLEKLNRQTATGRFAMWGRGDITAESTVTLQGFKTGVDGLYLLESVDQVYANGGWTTEIELSAGNTSKAGAGHHARKTKRKTVVKPTNITIPDRFQTVG